MPTKTDYKVKAAVAGAQYGELKKRFNHYIRLRLWLLIFGLSGWTMAFILMADIAGFGSVITVLWQDIFGLATIIVK